MRFNKTEILTFLENSELINMIQFTDSDVEEFYNSLDAMIKYNYDYAYGATKCVLIPNKGDYVIKIPFTGCWDWDWDEVKPFENADCSERYWDYCGAEYERFQEACFNNLEEGFAPIFFIGMVGNFPIYIQAKCITLNDKYGYNDKTSRFSKEERDKTLKTSEAYWVNINIDWLTDFRLCYGEEKLEDFLAFISDKEWDDDLRTENIGYFNNYPVLIDYAGFLE